MSAIRPAADTPDAAAAARIAAFTEFAGAVSRELADPMSIVIGRIEMALELSDPPNERDRQLRVAMEHARRVSATVSNLGGLGRAVPDATGVVCDALYRALDLAGPRLRSVEVRVEARPSRLSLRLDGALLARAVAEGLVWVLDRVGVAQRVDLCARRVDGHVVIVVWSGIRSDGAVAERLPGPVGPALTAAFGGECGAHARAGAAPWAEVSWRWPDSLAADGPAR